MMPLLASARLVMDSKFGRLKTVELITPRLVATKIMEVSPSGKPIRGAKSSKCCNIVFKFQLEIHIYMHVVLFVLFFQDEVSNTCKVYFLCQNSSLYLFLHPQNTLHQVETKPGYHLQRVLDTNWFSQNRLLRLGSIP